MYREYKPEEFIHHIEKQQEPASPYRPLDSLDIKSPLSYKERCERDRWIAEKERANKMAKQKTKQKTMYKTYAEKMVEDCANELASKAYLAELFGFSKQANPYQNLGRTIKKVEPDLNNLGFRTEMIRGKGWRVVGKGEVKIVASANKPKPVSGIKSVTKEEVEKDPEIIDDLVPAHFLEVVKSDPSKITALNELIKPLGLYAEFDLVIKKARDIDAELV